MEAVKQPLIQARLLQGMHLSKQCAQVKVVVNLLTINALFVFGVIVIPNGREDRYTVDDIAVGLEVGEEPIIVLIAAGAYRDAQKSLGVDVVAGSQDEANAAFIYSLLQRCGYLPLAACGGGHLADASAEIAEDGEGERIRRGVGRGEGPETIVVMAAGTHQAFSIHD